MNALLKHPPAPLVWLLAAILGATFVVASLDKIANPGDFAQSVYFYRLLPLPLLHPFALVLPWVELLAGAALLLPPLRRGAALLVAGMNLMFIIALISALWRGLDIHCGCFDAAGGHGVDLGLIVRDVLMFLACLPLIGQRR